MTIQEVSPELAESFGLDKPAGALVNSVDKGSAADKAGLQAGDVILKFNGTAISQSSELPPLVSDTAPGSNAALSVWRQGKPKELSITLGQMESGKVALNPPLRKTSNWACPCAPLNRQERAEAQVAGGLVVEDVADGPAKRAGLRSGDVILSVNGELASSPDTLKSQLGQGHKKMALLVLRR